MTTLGKKIRELREAKGYTLREFALQAGVSSPFLSDLERDKRRPTDETLMAIAKKLSVTFEELKEFDGRINDEVKEWLNEKPLMGTLMRKMVQMSPAKRDELVSKIQQVVEGDCSWVEKTIQEACRSVHGETQVGSCIKI